MIKTNGWTSERAALCGWLYTQHNSEPETVHSIPSGLVLTLPNTGFYQIKTQRPHCSLSLILCIDLACNIHVLVCVCVGVAVLFVCQSQSAEVLHLGTH